MFELLGANTDVLDRVAQSLSADALRMLDIRALAHRAMLELGAGWNGPDLLQLTHQWDRETSPQLAAVSASLDGCAARLRAQSTEQREASRGHAAGSGPAPGETHPLLLLKPAPLMNPALPLASAVLSSPARAAMGIEPASPPDHTSPNENATWWRSLSPPQQHQVIQDHPEWIGNRDGVDFTARDRANRSLLELHRGRLVADRERLKAGLADKRFGGTFTNDDAALDHVNDKLAALAAIDKTLAKTGDRQLLLLDLSAERAQAAIARGNVDSANDVAVFVPGMSANVPDALNVYDDTMGQLRRKAELESNRADPIRAATAAVVTWIGYQAPQLGWELIGDNSVADDHAASKGAALLVPFLRGIGAAREHDFHLTLLGHSYGSTVAGLALRHNTGVDDAVFFGSPGIGTSHLKDLLLDSGHVYYIEARRDPVGDLGYFGVDPSHLAGIEHASARASTVADPVTGEIRQLNEVVGHSSYLQNDSTSQYNMSVVVGGVPDRRVPDDGEGVGDVLSWPVPGTYR